MGCLVHTKSQAYSKASEFDNNFVVLDAKTEEKLNCCRFR